ncbi:MAG: M14 family metallopeptidase [Planctomycetota bacterium]|nr:M14 family metallopeptidase [Planctomycetota bacterium]
MRSHLLVSCWAALASSAMSAHLSAEDGSKGRGDPLWLLPLPEVQADPRIPTLEQVIGRAWAGDVSSHAEIERYLEALVAAAPERSRLETYGETYEGRKLHYLIVSAQKNLERLDEIRRDNLRLADPRQTSPEEARALVDRNPALVWLAYSIHGNETSSSDAALLTAYHLLADRREQTTRALERLVVFIDPLQNPDGRERFINVYRETRGVFPTAEPFASEHTERWPGGRFNHYLFDMNRDWFLHSQVETRGRVAAYLRWRPQIYVDAHEMGRDSHYYFVPPTEPVNPQTLPRQREWFYRLGRHQAEQFDRYGFAYTTREMFDAFYPGYGSEWPTLQGALGVLWEQAGVRGLVVERSDERQLHYHDAVRHHYVSGVATLELAAEHQRELLQDFYESTARGVQLGREGAVRHYFLLEGRRPHRAARLARLLVRNGIEVRRLSSSLRVLCTDVHEASKAERTVPAAGYHVPVAQPAGRLVRVLLDRHTGMGEEFIRRQFDRLKRRLRDEIYDVTAWSLPLAFDVPCLAVGESADVPSEAWDGGLEEGRIVGGRAKVAYLVQGDDDGTMLAVASWLKAGYRVHVADQSLQLGGVDFPKGTVILRRSENPESLDEAVEEAARKHQLTVHATDTGFVTRGAHLGGPHVKWVRPPEVLLLVDRPARYSVGHTWYLFDQVIRYPITRVAGRSLSRLDLSDYNVLILPDGRYAGGDAPDDAAVRRLKEWVQRGGTLILIRGAAAWAAGEKVSLLASRLLRKEVEVEGVKAPGEKTAPPAAPGDSAEAKPSSGSAPRPDEKLTEPPDPVPGAFIRAAVYDDHWVTFGYRPEVDVLLTGNLIFAPLKPTDGRNLVTFLPQDRALTSGFCWPRTLELLAGTPYVLYQAQGAGHVIAFSDDPNYRAMYPGVQRLFLNAVFFGPGH